MSREINLTPNFAQSTQICIMALENGTQEGKQLARAELMRYARELDRLAASAGGAFDPEDTPMSDE
jgi:hypothetical protein